MLEESEDVEVYGFTKAGFLKKYVEKICVQGVGNLLERIVFESQSILQFLANGLSGTAVKVAIVLAFLAFLAAGNNILSFGFSSPSFFAFQSRPPTQIIPARVQSSLGW